MGEFQRLVQTPVAGLTLVDLLVVALLLVLVSTAVDYIVGNWRKR